MCLRFAVDSELYTLHFIEEIQTVQCYKILFQRDGYVL